MAECITPPAKRCRSRILDDPNLKTPIKIPATPFLKQIGHGLGVSVYSLERSPKVGFIRSPWAIKKRNIKIKDGEKYTDRIRFEAEVLKKLNHPNVVGFRAYSEIANGDPCLAMEKLDLSLGDRIEKLFDSDITEPFAADLILNIGYEIIKGLEYLHHEAHILHGDIKSYNILISDDYKIVKLCDFGVSLPLNESLELDTTKGDFCYIGTQCWSSYEVINENIITNKADIWAYGLVIWEMIALSPPHVESADESMTDLDITSEMCDKFINGKSYTDSNDIELSFMEDKYGTRPPLPSIELGPEYANVLELFYACTTVDYKLRPSAKGVRQYFKNCVFKNKS